MMSSPFSRDRDDVLRLPDGDHAQRARDDRHMRRRAALFEHDGAQPRAVVLEQLGRPHVAGDENGVLGQLAAGGRGAVAGEDAQQPIGEIVEIVQPVADIGIGRAQHAGARVVLHALDGGLGGEAVGDGLVQPVDPAAIVGEHAVGFEDVAMLGAGAHVAVAQHVVDRDAHGGERRLETPRFLLGVLGDEVGDDDARIVQHDLARARCRR